MINKHILYLGLNDKDSKQQEIDTISAYKLVLRCIVAAGYEGATVSESTGFYTHENSDLVVEKSLRIEILFAETEKTMNLIKQLKSLFNQESIALQTETINSQLI